MHFGEGDNYYARRTYNVIGGRTIPAATKSRDVRKDLYEKLRNENKNEDFAKFKKKMCDEETMRDTFGRDTSVCLRKDIC